MFDILTKANNVSDILDMHDSLYLSQAPQGTLSVPLILSLICITILATSILGNQLDELEYY